jgi:hypothetical protein
MVKTNKMLSKLPVPAVKIIPFVFLANLLSGCSYETEFVITNKTNNVLKVAYQFRKESTKSGNCFDDYSKPVPSIKSISEMWKQELKWRKLDKNQYRCDDKELRVEFLLQPNMAVNIDSMRNFRVQDINIQSLTLQGNGGSIIYQGDRVIRGFRKVKDTLHVLEYE